MDNREDGLLRDIIKWKRGKVVPDPTIKLGNVVGEILHRDILPQHEKCGNLSEVWGDLLPVELAGHCRIVRLEEGQLKVAVDSPSYGHEIRLCQAELLKALNSKCPRAKIRSIKVVAG